MSSRGYMQFSAQMKTKSSDEDFLYFKGIASNGEIDRHGDVISPQFWSQDTIRNYMTNPALLYAHDHRDVAGTITKAYVDGNQLHVEGRVAKRWEKSWQVEQGLLKALSVSIAIKDAEVSGDGVFIIKEGEWMETSLVAVGANQNALFALDKNFQSPDRDEVVNKFAKSMSFLEKFASQLKKKFGVEVPDEVTEEGLLASLEDFDFNGAIEKTVSDQVDALRKKSEEETPDISPLQEAISEIQGRLEEFDEVKSQLTDLKEQLAEFSIKTRMQPGGDGSEVPFKTIENLETGLKAFKIGKQKNFNE